MVISHNISALNTYKALGIAGKSSNKSMERLSSGYRINRAGDDAAGLSISEKMRSQIRGLNQASTNAANGVSMIQTAEGALNETHSILQRMRELAVQSATDTNATEDKEALQSELEQLSAEINRIGNTTEFNGMKILDGSKGDSRIYADADKAAIEAKTGDVKGLELSSVAKDGALNGWKVKVLTSGGTEAGAVIKDEDAKIITVKFDTAAHAEVDGKIVDALNTAEGFGAGKVSGTGTFSLGGDTSCEFEFAGGHKALKAGDLIEGADDSVYFHVGANRSQVINCSFKDMRAKGIGITFDKIPTKVVDGKGDTIDLATDEEKAIYFTKTKTVNNGTDTVGEEYALNITTREGANYAIQKIDEAIKSVSKERSKFGAVQNRLEYTINNLNTTAENMQAAESTIRDVDMAKEIMEYTKNNILQQAAQAMLVQANARPQQALQLLQ